MKVAGAKIAQLRREQNMCVAEFARQIEQPIWLVILAENGHIDYIQELLDLLPDHVIETLLRQIIEVFGVSPRWLTTRYQSPKHPPLPEDQNPQLPLLYLPIIICAEDVIHYIYDMLSFIQLRNPDDIETISIAGQGIHSVVLLFNLLMSLLKKNGFDVVAAEEHEQLQTLLQTHIKDADSLFKDIAPKHTATNIA